FQGSTKESGFFEGIDTTLPHLLQTLKKPEPPGSTELLGTIAAAVTEAMRAFTLTDPSAAVPALAKGLAATRTAIGRFGADADARFVLQVKEQQFMDAINAALGIDLVAVAQPPSAGEPAGRGSPFAAPPTMGPLVPGRSFEIQTVLSNRGKMTITPSQIDLVPSPGLRV